MTRDDRSKKWTHLMHNSLLKIQLTYARGTTYNYRAWRYCHGLRDDPYQTLLAVGQAKGLISWLLKKNRYIGVGGFRYLDFQMALS